MMIKLILRQFCYLLRVIFAICYLLFSKICDFWNVWDQSVELKLTVPLRAKISWKHRRGAISCYVDRCGYNVMIVVMYNELFLSRFTFRNSQNHVLFARLRRKIHSFAFRTTHFDDFLARRRRIFWQFIDRFPNFPAGGGHNFGSRVRLLKTGGTMRGETISTNSTDVRGKGSKRSNYARKHANRSYNLKTLRTDERIWILEPPTH